MPTARKQDHVQRTQGPSDVKRLMPKTVSVDLAVVHLVQQRLQLRSAKVRPFTPGPLLLSDLRLDRLNQFGVGAELVL